MFALNATAVARRHFAWLLWLAMLLPLAQIAGASHLLSHSAAQAAGEADSKQALHQIQCELCVSAAAVVGGALATHATVLGHLAAPQQTPQDPVASAPAAGNAAAYASRAPPSILV